MTGRLLLAALLALLIAGQGAGAAPPRTTIETDVSSRLIAIESNFTGVRLVVFGSIADKSRKRRKATDYQLAVVVRGPETPIVTRQKSRVLGIWANTDSRPYQNVPGYYAVLSTRPLNQLAEPDVLIKYGIGFDSLLIERTETGTPEDPFREAVLRIRAKEGLFQRDNDGVTFVGEHLFRATVELPATVPVGEYWTDVFVFSDGKLLSHNSSAIVIQKEGFERFIYTMAFDTPLLYGIVAVIAAMLAGLLASAVFRKD